ncbi:WW domain-containing oxidoreductase [Favolaschia claudopus]|uniref:WW domain-containing oxidoreductase n=1 Tax=Favolaschia claudopus TaxID=2862362 RepID=A0AAW0BMT6_9AGAR
MKVSVLSFIADQRSKQPTVLRVDLTGKTVVVVGANTGLGFEATKHFAGMGAGRIVMACRSRGKGEAAVERLKSETGYSRAELWIVDLAEFSSVREFADRFERDGGRLDILVENAAMRSFEYTATKDGWDMSLQVNHLSTSLLALLLLPIMIRTAKQHATVPRIVVVSSDMHYFVKFSRDIAEDPEILKTLGGAEYCKNPKNMQDRYELTKLFNVFFVRALNAHIPPSTPIIVSAVDPGFCYSELRRESSGIRVIRDWLMESALAFSSEVGSRRIVWTALAHQEDPDRLRGEYTSSFKVKEVSDLVLSPVGVEVERRSWDELVGILGKVDPRVTETVERYLSRV